jgi:hypothetical protein
MNNIKWRKATAILAVVIILTSLSTVSSGADQLQETVRVGLYYKGSSVNTAQSIFDVSAQAGMQIGFFQNGTFVEIYREASPSALYIRKDDFYYDTGSGLKEYDPSSSNVSGTKYGPYHIKIGSDCPDAIIAADQDPITGRWELTPSLPIMTPGRYGQGYVWTKQTQIS